ncbi:M28 family peptidase [Fodinibius sp. N2]|uniref:M28 family peptidase n=1 Tax=Fodinibius alkaliphilus TaxID=3140241 RepID=UPI00315A216C
MIKLRILLLLSGLLFFLISCEGGDQQQFSFEEQGQEVPEFSADSAYQFIGQQLSYGPRNPNAEGHKLTKEYLLNRLQDYAGQRYVFSQQFTAQGYDGDSLALSNIIASFNPQSSDRIFLCAHWDTRPRADKDSLNQDKPILGADDGGSGVGVLLELARIFKDNPPPIGVDIVLFDGEDYGREGDFSKYFLGSRHWSENPPVKGYSPRFGILLDMVGGKNARFPKEGYSMQFAPGLVEGIWDVAEDKGYSNLFISEQGNRVSDDHLVINRILGIPTINIIHYSPSNNGAQFASYWHTHNDDMSIISKKTLNGVGEILVELIYNRIEGSN